MQRPRPTLTPAQSATVRDEVAGMLARSPSFQALPPADRAEIVRNTTKVAEAMTLAALPSRAGAPVKAASRPRRHAAADDPYAAGLADAPSFPNMPGTSVTSTTTPGGTIGPSTPNDDRWRPDERFRAEGIAQGVTQVGRMINEVNFPGFVSSLVKGTFNAVVDASIQQMKAYGELVQSVAMSVNDFRDQNVSPAQGRSHLVSKFPQLFQMARDGDDETVQLKDDADTDNLPDFAKELGLSGPIDDLDESTVDLLVQASRDDLARGRQQLLATTIMMGINRIIITDGRINAKLKFNFSAQDTMNRTGTVAETEMATKRMVVTESLAGKVTQGVFEQPVPITVSTTTGESSANLNASGTLTGEVSLNFRSDVFPLDQMVNTDQMLKIREARGGAGSAPAAPVAGQTPPTP